MKEYKDYNYLTKAVPLPGGGRKYIRAKTKRELDRKVLEFQIAMARGDSDVVPMPGEHMTVEQLADMWLEKVKRPSVREQTYRVYETLVRCHLSPAIGPMKVSDVRSVHIIDAINRCGYAAKAGNQRMLSMIRSIFQFAVENEIISKSPAPSRMTVTGKSARDETPLTPNQTKLLLDYCKATAHDLYLFTLLAIVTGMRRGEIAALRWDCVDFHTGEIKVRRNMVDSTGEVTEELKTPAARREIPVSPDVLAILRRERSNANGIYVIPGNQNGHLSDVQLDQFVRVWNRSGVTPSHIHAHLFRKTFATRLIESGTDPKRVQYLLGHTTLDMTLRIYAKYDRESQIENTRAAIQEVFLHVL